VSERIRKPRRRNEPVKTPAEPRTILVVDDEEGVREVATQYLSARGYLLWRRESGARALELASAHPGPIHVLLTDAVMPGMKRAGTRRKLRGQRPETKVLYMSAYAEDTSLLEEANERGEGFLQNPSASMRSRKDCANS